MKISVFGLGYVGAVSAGCLARDGHEVIGVDTAVAKVDLINKGQSPIIESDIDDVINCARREGSLRATTDTTDAVQASEISFVCVGTPSRPSGDTDFGSIRRVCHDIGVALRDKLDFHVVVVRSTMLPGSSENVVIPILEAASNKLAGLNFGVCYHPEFLREGNAVADYYDPPKAIFGATDERSTAMLCALYNNTRVPIRRMDMAAAELVKYIDNTWHALKVCFANEVGVLAQALKIDGIDLMEVFCSDTKLNISAKYLRPGFAFGGSCLPKDVRAITYQSRRLDLELPVFNAILRSNEIHVERALTLILQQGARQLGFLGISFKAGTDDLRGSPVVELIERLLGKGYDIRIYDRNVSVARLVGTNRDYVLNHIPHLSEILEESIETVLDHAKIIIIGNQDPEFARIPERMRPNQIVVDLVGVCQKPLSKEQYLNLS
jgi:GDP-mannose 6-dehydrogenase